MYLDIDKFKDINDAYGHNFGDKVLRAFSQRIARAIRNSDTVTRTGDDEFRILISHLASLEGMHSMTQALCNAMKVLLIVESVELPRNHSAGSLMGSR